MLSKIIEFSIKNKLLIIVGVFGMILYGSYEITQLPIDAVPDITNNQVQVITVAPSLGAPDIERLITFPIEQNCRNIPDIIEMRSFSRSGLSLVTIVFKDKTDIYWARQQVTERLKTAQKEIPDGTGIPELAPVTTGLGEIYQYVLKPKKGYENRYSLTDLRTIQDWIIKRQLAGIKGVADVSSFGGLVKQYEIAIDPQKLNAYQLSITDIFDALHKNNENTGGAYIEKQNTVLFIRVEGLLKSPNELKQIVVKNTEQGIPVLLENVAEIKTGHAIRYGALSYNDEGESVGGIVMMLKGENSSRVIKDVKKRIVEIERNLPEGLEIVPYLDRTKMVNAAIHTVSTNLMEGALIVVFVLVLFLGNIRAGIIVASVIPLSMLFAVIMMNIFGVSGNLMSLGALDFGLIVDGAVIITEAVLHSLTHNKMFANLTKLSQKDMDTEVTHTSLRMMNVAIFGQIIILIVYLPIFTLQGIEGKMFRPMAQTVIFCLLGAFILSITYIPVITSLFISKKIQSKTTFSERFIAWISKQHQKLLHTCLRFSAISVSVVFILFAVAIFLLTRLGGEFIPQIPEGDFAVETRVLKGSNLNTSVQVCTHSAKILMAHFPEIEKIVSKTGSGEIPTDPMPMENSDMMIILKNKKEWKSADTWEELAEKMNETLKNNIPGVTYSFQYPVALRFNELMTGAKQDVVCKIFGENLDTLSKYSKKLGHIVSDIQGAADIYVEPIDGLPQLIIAYKRTELAKYGIAVQDVNRIINTALAGQSAGMLYQDEKRFDIVVRLAKEQKQNLEQIRNLLVKTPNGTQIPLYQIANVEIKESINQIQREDAKRRIIVGFNVKNRDVQSVVQDVQQVVQKKLKLPAGYYITYGGAFENLESAKKRLMLAVPVALLLIFFLLYMTFHSVKQGILVYSAIPLSAIGGIFFLFLRGMPFSVSAGVGFIALFGVAVLNGIVLISEFNRLKSSGIQDIYAIVQEGTRIRLRPVLMTALVASLGFLPMAVSKGAGAEVQKPLATVVIGGLLIATFLTLIILPVLYVWAEKFTLKKPAKIVSLFIFGLLFVKNTNAQTPISLKNAIDSALKNNLLIPAQTLQTEYQKSLLKASYDVPKTNFSFEYGQLNSIFYDNRLSVMQSTAFPTVYSKQKNLQKMQTDEQSLKTEILKKEIIRKVSEIFYQLSYLYQKRILLQKTDTLLNQVTKRIQLRFAKGDANTLEKTTTELQELNIQIQLQDVENEIQNEQKNFQYWLNSSENHIPEPVSTTNILVLIPQDTTTLREHIQMQVLQQSLRTKQAKIMLEKHKFLPDLYIGFFSQTLQGIGANDLFYTRNTRFTSFQVGVGIPLFYTAQKANLNAAKIQYRITQQEYNIGIKLFQNQYKIAVNNYQRAVQKIRIWEENLLPKSKILLIQANQQLETGAISYTEWAVLVQQAIHIQLNYLEDIRTLYFSLTELQYYQTN
jgi:cobalt-zinc-cadmium resistance protein CzcA